MTAPRVGAITAPSVVSAFDKVSRFEKSSSAGAYLGLTPRRYKSGEVSRNGHISKHGNGMTRKTEFAPQNDTPIRVNTMNLENMLCEINPNRRNQHDGRLLSMDV